MRAEWGWESGGYAKISLKQLFESAKNKKMGLT